MAGRPIKNNADFFSHDADASEDPKLVYLEAKFGSDGYKFFFKMLEFLCRCDFHEYPADEFHLIILAEKLKFTFDRFKEILSEATREEITAFVIENGKIFSPGLKKRLSQLHEKREKMREKYISDEENPISDAEIPISDAEITQSRVKQSKAENILLKQRAEVLSTNNNKSNFYAEDIQIHLLPLPFENTKSALDKILSDNETSDHPKANGQRMKTVKKIMAEHPEMFIRQKLRHFIWMQRYKPPKNPTGYLIKSIQERYPPPAGFDEWLDQEKTNFRKRNEGNRDPTESSEAVRDIIHKALAN